MIVHTVKQLVHLCKKTIAFPDNFAQLAFHRALSLIIDVFVVFFLIENKEKEIMSIVQYHESSKLQLDEVCTA